MAGLFYLKPLGSVSIVSQSTRISVSFSVLLLMDFIRVLSMILFKLLIEESHDKTEGKSHSRYVWDDSELLTPCFGS